MKSSQHTHPSPVEHSWQVISCSQWKHCNWGWGCDFLLVEFRQNPANLDKKQKRQHKLHFKIYKTCVCHLQNTCLLIFKCRNFNHTLFIIIIFPDCSYESALVCCSLPTRLLRRDEACRRFISNIKESGFLSHLLLQPTNVAHGYGLRSGFSCSEFRFVRTDHLSNFVTHSYNRI